MKNSITKNKSDMEITCSYPVIRSMLVFRSLWSAPGLNFQSNTVVEFFYFNFQSLVSSTCLFYFSILELNRNEVLCRARKNYDRSSIINVCLWCIYGWWWINNGGRAERNGSCFSHTLPCVFFSTNSDTRVHTHSNCTSYLFFYSVPLSLQIYLCTAHRVYVVWHNSRNRRFS